MNGEQFFELLGDLDESMIAAAARPPKRRQPVNAWLLAAAAAVVVGVLGYAGVLRAWRDAPPVKPPLPVTVVTTESTAKRPTITDTTTQKLPTTIADTTTYIFATTTESTSTAATTTVTPTTTATTTVNSTTVNFTTTATRLTGSDTVVTTTVLTTTDTVTQIVGNGNDYPTATSKYSPYSTTTTTASSTTPKGDTTTVPVTKGTMPNGLPVLNDDGYVVTDRANGYVDFVLGYSFGELQVQSITTAPSVLPVYAVTEECFEKDTLSDIVEDFVILTDDTLVSGIYDDGKSANATGERFRYYLNRRECNYLKLALIKPITLGTPDQWLSQVTAYCPALFRDMAQPTLHLWNGSRWWNKQYTDSPAAAQETVSFFARIYDAATAADEAARWLNGVSLVIENGKLTAFCVMFEDNYQKLGDYPILSVSEATALAREQCETLKNYPHYTIISENYEILSTELVYMPHSASGLRVPLYRFLVTTDGAEYMSELRAETGLTMYYAVYVTAVPPAYWTADSNDRFITQK